jgi:hypothetical protein
MPTDGTIGGLVGKLDMLRIECPTCGRRGRFQVARLLEELGPGYHLTDWLHERTADCPQKNQAGVTRACGAVLAEWANGWITIGAPGRRRKRNGRRTVERYEELLRCHVLPVLGERRLQQLRPTEIDDLYVGLESKLAPRTVCHVHSVLGACSMPPCAREC